MICELQDMYFGEYFIRIHKSRKWFYHLILDWLALCKCMLDCFRNLNCGMLVDMNFNDHNNFLFSDHNYLTITVYEMMSKVIGNYEVKCVSSRRNIYSRSTRNKINLLNLSLLVNYVFSIKCSSNICFYFSSFKTIIQWMFMELQVKEFT